MDNRPIGIFDSGVGGLSMVRALKKHLPGESFVYFADLAHMPYGPRTRENIIELATEICTFLCARGVKAILVACGTATANALPVLQKSFSVPIYGVIDDGVRAAVGATDNGRIGVIATEAAVRSGEFERRLQAVDAENADISPEDRRETRRKLQIAQQACPEFVLLAENGKFKAPETYQAAEKYLKYIKTQSVDTLILGCTHYPLLSEVISETMGEGVKLINPSEELMKRLKTEWTGTGQTAGPAPERSETYFVTARPEVFGESYRTIMGDICPNLRRALPLKIVSGTTDNVSFSFGQLGYSEKAARARLSFDWRISGAENAMPVTESVDIFFDAAGNASKLRRVSQDAKMDFVPERETDGTLNAGPCTLNLALYTERLRVSVNPLEIELFYRVNGEKDKYLFAVSEEK